MEEEVVYSDFFMRPDRKLFLQDVFEGLGFVYVCAHVYV